MGKRRTLGTARRTWVVGALLALAIGIVGPAAGGADQNATLGVWTAARAQEASGSDVQPKTFRSYELDQDAIAAILAQAPRENTTAARSNPLVVSLPGPDGAFQRFAIFDSPSWSRARRDASGDQDLQRPRDRRLRPRRSGRPEPARLPRLGPLRRTAPGTSTRTSTTTRVYVSYFAATSPTDHGRHVRVRGGRRARRTPAARLDARRRTAAGRPPVTCCAPTGSRWSPTRRTPRTSAPANVTAAKVTLMNRVDQIYEDETVDPAWS